MVSGKVAGHVVKPKYSGTVAAAVGATQRTVVLASPKAEYPRAPRIKNGKSDIIVARMSIMPCCNHVLFFVLSHYVRQDSAFVRS
jgi:hypothetical protein